jgi:hypothetical protein
MASNLAQRGLNFCTTSSLLTATGAETVHDTTVLLNFAINGKAYTKSGTNADQATPTTDAVTGAAFPTLTGVASAGGQGTVVVWMYNSDGTVKCAMGSVETLDAAGNFLVRPQFPPIPDSLCPFAYQVLKHYGQTSSVTFGTSNWNTSGFTNAIVNVLVLPDRPQVS